MLIREKSVLFSAYNKKQILKLAIVLKSLEWKFYATSGTCEFLKNNNLQCINLEEITKVPAILDHRVFTEHYKIAGALVSDPTKKHDLERKKFNIPWFDMLVVDLYPLEKSLAKFKKTKNSESIRNSTDIGGITLIRNAIKGRRIVVTNKKQYSDVEKILKNKHTNPEKRILEFLVEGELLCSKYCQISGNHLDNIINKVPKTNLHKLKYGENPYQQAFFKKNNKVGIGVDILKSLKTETNNVSFNNLTSISLILDTYLKVQKTFKKNFQATPFICLGFKHGHAVAGAFDWENKINALNKTLWSNPKTIWGGEIIVNFEINENISKKMIEDKKKKWMFNIIIAKSFKENALSNFKKRKKTICSEFKKLNLLKFPKNQKKFINGGTLIQKYPNYIFNIKMTKFKSKFFKTRLLDDLCFAWAISNSTHMNSISLVSKKTLIHNDGQPASIDSLRSFSIKSKNDSKDTVFAANAFFPFIDCAKKLKKIGVVSGILPSGGIRQDEIIGYFEKGKIGIILIKDLYRGFSKH